MKQSGFILQGPMLLYGALGAAAIILGLTASVWIQTARLEAKTAQYDAFVVKTKAVGEAQELKTKETEAKHKQLAKEKDDAIAIARSNHADDIKRMRDKYTRSSILPTAPASSVKPHLACFDRQELSEAIRGFTGEVGEIVAEGESCTLELNNAREWAKLIQ